MYIYGMATADIPSSISAIHPSRRLWTREEYYRLHEQGYFVDQRVELIDGEIVLMSPRGHKHAATVALIIEALREAFGNGYWIRGQESLLASEVSVPEPDVAVVKGTPRTVRDTPATALLVAEVSISTLAFDLGRKAQIYAAAGVKDYWVVDVPGQRVIVHRNPSRGKYAKVTEHLHGESLPLVALPKRKVKVDDLLL